MFFGSFVPVFEEVDGMLMLGGQIVIFYLVILVVIYKILVITTHNLHNFKKFYHLSSFFKLSLLNTAPLANVIKLTHLVLGANNNCFILLRNHSKFNRRNLDNLKITLLNDKNVT